MISKEPYFDFPDYSAENQERDTKRHEEQQEKDVYLVKIRGNYGAYLSDGDDNICYENFKAKNLKEFYYATEKFFKKIKVKPRYHVLINKGIEEHILQQMVVQKLLGR